MSATFPDSPFWNFSLTTYGAEGVAPACLALQERYGTDVNLLLWSLWQGMDRGHRLSRESLQQAIDRVSPWHTEVVRALRRVRQRMKTPFDGVDAPLQQALRARLQKLEIDTEHLEQIILTEIGEAAAPGTVPGMSTAVDNAVLYLSALGAELDEADRQSLAVICGALVGGPSLEDVADLVGEAADRH